MFKMTSSIEMTSYEQQLAFEKIVINETLENDYSIRYMICKCSISKVHSIYFLDDVFGDERFPKVDMTGQCCVCMLYIFLNTAKC